MTHALEYAWSTLGERVYSAAMLDFVIYVALYTAATCSSKRVLSDYTPYVFSDWTAHLSDLLRNCIPKQSCLLQSWKLVDVISNPGLSFSLSLILSAKMSAFLDVLVIFFLERRLWYSICMCMWLVVCELGNSVRAPLENLKCGYIFSYSALLAYQSLSFIIFTGAFDILANNCKVVSCLTCLFCYFVTEIEQKKTFVYNYTLLNVVTLMATPEFQLLDWFSVVIPNADARRTVWVVFLSSVIGGKFAWFGMQQVQQVIDASYRDMVRYLTDIWNILGWLCYLLSVLTSILMLVQDSGLPEMSVLPIVLHTTVVTWSIRYAACEIKQVIDAYNHDIVSYCVDVWNLLDWACYILTISTSTLMIVEDSGLTIPTYPLSLLIHVLAVVLILATYALFLWLTGWFQVRLVYWIPVILISFLNIFADDPTATVGLYAGLASLFMWFKLLYFFRAWKETGTKNVFVRQSVTPSVRQYMYFTLTVEQTIPVNFCGSFYF